MMWGKYIEDPIISSGVKKYIYIYIYIKCKMQKCGSMKCKHFLKYKC